MPIGTSKVGALGGLVPGGSVTFNTSGTFCVPPGVKVVSLDGTGGAGNPGNPGNSGNPGNPGSGGAGGGGGAGAISGGFFSQPSAQRLYYGMDDQKGGAAYKETITQTPWTPINLNVLACAINVRNSPLAAAGGWLTITCSPTQPSSPVANPASPGGAGGSGSAGSAGSAGNPGQSSSALGNTFPGGAGGAAGNAGNAGTGGSGGTAGNAGTSAPLVRQAGGPGGSGGNGAGNGGPGTNAIGFNDPGGVFWIESGGGGGGAGINTNGGNSTVGIGNTNPRPATVTQMVQNTGGGAGGIGIYGPYNTLRTPPIPGQGTFGYGGSGQGRTLGIGQYGGQAAYSPYCSQALGTPPYGNALNQSNTSVQSINNIPGCWTNNAALAAVKAAHFYRAGAGGAGGGVTRVTGPTPIPGPLPSPAQNSTRGSGGGGGGGRGNLGNAGGAGGAGGCGQAANPTTFNCVPVTPGCSYPVTVACGGSVTISWNPQ